jgi:hypothetical protein
VSSDAQMRNAKQNMFTRRRESCDGNNVASHMQPTHAQNPWCILCEADLLY